MEVRLSKTFAVMQTAQTNGGWASVAAKEERSDVAPSP